MHRHRLPFRSVNSASSPSYDPGFHRHHILPLQLLSCRCFNKLFEAIGRKDMDFDDFRMNGMLLPANSVSAMRSGLPLHRGPHREYNAMAIDRVGMIEQRWASARLKRPVQACHLALTQLDELQRELGRRLLDRSDRDLTLNRKDPFLAAQGFAELDAMAEALWSNAVQIPMPTAPRSWP